MASRTIRKDIQHILHELKEGLAHIYGERLRAVYLFGSYARGEADSDSDVDILIVLSDMENYAAELRRTSQRVGGLSFKHEVTLSIIFAREAEWHTDTLPLFSNVRVEGISV